MKRGKWVIATILITGCLFSSAIAETTRAVFTENFDTPLSRSFYLTANGDKSLTWECGHKFSSPGDRLLVRFFADYKSMKNMTVIQIPENKVVFRKDFSNEWKTCSVPLSPNKNYQLKISGEFTAAAQKFSAAGDFYSPGWRLPSWTVSKNLVTKIKTGKNGEPYTAVKPLPETTGGGMYARIYSLQPGKEYEVSLRYRTSDGQKFKLFIKEYDKKARRVHNREIQSSPVWRTFRTSFIPSMRNIILSINGISSEVFFKNLTITEKTTPGNIVKAGKRTYTRNPRQKEKDPRSGLAETTGLIFYHRPPRMVYPNSVPQNYERINEIRTFSVPGEYACWDFIVYAANRDFTIRNVKLSDLRSGKGETLPGENIKVNYVKFWKQASGTSYYVIPELILPFAPGILPKDENRIFWLQVRLPETCKPGAYKGSLTLRTGDGRLKMPLYLKVLPFKLVNPKPREMVWGTYSSLHLRPQRFYPRSQKIRYLKEMKDYGVTTLVARLGLYENSIREMQELRREAGMDGPLVINSVARYNVTRKLGYKSYAKVCDQPDVRKALSSAIRNADGWVKKYGKGGYENWYFYGVDEPQCGTRMPSALSEIRVVRENHVKTAYAVYPYYAVKKMAPYLNVSLNSYILEDEATLKRFKSLGRKYNLQYWYLAGAYLGQEGGLMPNRMFAGLSCFKGGLTGYVAYRHQSNLDRIRKNPMDNFSNGRPYCMTYPDPKRSAEHVSISTLQWEGLREGITDYKYLLTLKAGIEEAKKRGESGKAAEAEKTLAEILSFVPWRKEYRSGDYLAAPGNFTNDKAQKLRWMTARAIIKLKGADQ